MCVPSGFLLRLLKRIKIYKGMNIREYKEKMASLIECMEAECGEQITSIVIERDGCIADYEGNIISSRISIEIDF